jgi:hypothetical protein
MPQPTVDYTLSMDMERIGVALVLAYGYFSTK